MAVLGSLSYSFPSNLSIIATVFVTLLAVTLAHTYAETINLIMKARRIVPWRALVPILFKQSWVIVAAFIPMIVFGLAAIGLITPDIAFQITEISLIIILFLFGFLSRRLVGGSLIRAISYGVVAVILGLILVEIKLWAKYLPDIGQ